MSTIWNKVVVLGLSVALCSPAFANGSSNEVASQQDQAQVQTQDVNAQGQGDASSTSTTVQESKTKKEVKSCKRGKHKSHKKGKKDSTKEASNAKDDGMMNANTNEPAKDADASKTASSY